MKLLCLKTHVGGAVGARGSLKPTGGEIDHLPRRGLKKKCVFLTEFPGCCTMPAPSQITFSHLCSPLMVFLHQATFFLFRGAHTPRTADNHTTQHTQHTQHTQDTQDTKRGRCTPPHSRSTGFSGRISNFSFGSRVGYWPSPYVWANGGDRWPGLKDSQNI